MYTAQQLDDMRNHPDRRRLLSAILDAHDALANPTPTSTEVVNRIRSGHLEVLFDGNMPPLGGLAPGENPVILGAQGVLGNPHTTADPIHGLMMATVHEGVHHLDVLHGRSLPGAAATVEQRFFTELHAYTAEFELATANGLQQYLHTEFWGARNMNDISNAVLSVEAYLVPQLSRQPGLEQAVIQRVGAMFPAIP
jgi:hypothetical protein